MCWAHGEQPGILVSPDVDRGVRTGNDPVRGLRRVDLHLKGPNGPVLVQPLCAIVSNTFAEEQGLVGDPIACIDEEPWNELLERLPLCVECMREAYAGLDEPLGDVMRARARALGKPKA